MTAPDDSELDRLLRGALAPPERPSDRGFVLRVDRVVAEAERYRRSRNRLRRRLATEALALGALASSLAVIAQAPGLRQALASAPELGWAALLAMLLTWMLVRGRGALA